MEDFYLFPSGYQDDAGEFDYNRERDEKFGALGNDIEDWNDWEDDDDWDEEDDEEYWLYNCSKNVDGDCPRAGDEECDFDCPFRRMQDEKEVIND